MDDFEDGPDDMMDLMEEEEQQVSYAHMEEDQPPEEVKTLAAERESVIYFSSGLNAEQKKRKADDFEAFLQKCSRPAVPADFDPAKESIAFMQIDIDYTTAPNHPTYGVPGNPNPELPVLRMYGVTSEGRSVMAHIHGFMPYFYAQCPNGFRDCDTLRNKLEERLRVAQGVPKHLAKMVLGVEIVQKESLLHYSKAGKSPFFKVTVALPRMVATCRGFIDRGMDLGGPDSRLCEPSYETNLPFALRYMIDRDIGGGSWVEAPAGVYSVRPRENKVSLCQLEIDINYKNLVAHAPEGKWIAVAPLRVLSLDIECVKAHGQGFPSAEEDPVIQVACVLTEFGKPEPVCKTVFTLNSCAAIAGAEVFSFDSEAEMLVKLTEFFRRMDPDLLTGYNVVNFDMPYLITRAKTLGCVQQGATCWGRIKKLESKVKDTVFSSKAHGTRENKDINIEGRVQFDLLVAIQREYKLRSYTLNAVSAHFLGEQKEDVQYNIIGDLFRGTDETRRRVAVYCLKDAVLPIRLFESLLFMYNYVEMARVTGTPLSFLLTRGQQIKVVSQLYRKCLNIGYVIPTVRQQASDDKYEGATVLEPKKGFYAEPIATLDFASLYPSIMMANNLCYCTLIPKHRVPQADPDSYVRTPTGDCFVKADVRKGVLPMILDELLTARKRAKKAMGEATDPLVKSVLNGRQLALKISANSVYGFTGATVGQLACLEISSSVTAFGRTMIDTTKRLVEERYTVANGYKHNADVVYGDTDSVMVRFGTDNIGEAMRLGLEASELISKAFPKPVKLEFEKVYCPFLLMNKKRYAALMWTKEEKYDKLDFKGIETVRRDNCALVQQLVEKVMHLILIEQDIDGAIAYTKRTIADLLQNKVDLSLLVISKSLGKSASSEDYAARQAHVELAERMRKRDPGTAPGVGDRVAYVIIKGSKGQPAYEKAEDPLYVLEHNLAIDAHHYLEHQLKQPLLRIFEPIMKNPESLFSGEHTRSVAVLTSTTGALSKFVTKSLTCLGCKTVIKSGALCQHCLAGKEQQIVASKMMQMREKEKEFADLWVQCQRCQGSLHADVICTSRDCPIFYRRTKAQKEIATVQDQFERLQLNW